MSDDLTDERAGELLARLPAVPEAWVEAAARIPRTERDLADVQRRLDEDALLREAVRQDPERALREAGVDASPEVVARLRASLREE